MKSLFCKRHRYLTGAALTLLLCFTVADLTGDVMGAPVCASDADAGESGGRENDRSSSKPNHIDDCFCCSGCVESSPRFTFDSRLWIVHSTSPVQFQHASLPPAELYRPPKAF
ncbi:MAG: hypothetical protein ACRD3V_09505 [Vicinamibacteria bacterium]